MGRSLRPGLKSHEDRLEHEPEQDSDDGGQKDQCRSKRQLGKHGRIIAIAGLMDKMQLPK